MKNYEYKLIFCYIIFILFVIYYIIIEYIVILVNKCVYLYYECKHYYNYD